MSKFSHVKFRLFVAWNIHAIVFLLIFVFWLLLFCWCLSCLYCFHSLNLSFSCLRVFLSMYRHYLQYWRAIFLLFLIHTPCRCYLWDIRPYASSWVFLFSGPFVEILPSSTLRIVPSILQRVKPRCLSLLYKLVSSSFLVQLRYSLKFFFQLRLFPFTKEEIDSVLRKIKNRKAAGLDEIPPKVWKTRQFDDILLRQCNAVYNQNPIDRWMKGCIPPFLKKVSSD